MEYSMTETQTDPSPWDGLIERMQGRMMVAGQCSVEGPEDTASLMAQAEAEFLRECLNAIATARAAEATQHQQEIESLHRRHADELAAVRSSQQLIDQIATLRAERDRLKAALSKITALDFEKFNGRHNFYSGAVMFVKAWLLAYAALTPHQGQSTDGETR